MRTGVVYKVSIGKDFIIGSSISPDKREDKYLYDLKKNRHNNSYVQRAFNKYGEKDFTFEVMQENIPEEILECVEDIWMGAQCAMAVDDRGGMNMKSANRPKFSKEICDKISESNGLKVYQYDLEGNFVKEWKSRIKAAIHVKGSNELICKCCNFTRGQHKGFMWFDEFKGNKIKPYRKKPNPFRKGINQKSLTGEIVKKWDSLTNINSVTGFAISNISKVLNGKRPLANGFKWEFA